MHLSVRSTLQRSVPGKTSYLCQLLQHRVCTGPFEDGDINLLPQYPASLPHRQRHRYRLPGRQPSPSDYVMRKEVLYEIFLNINKAYDSLDRDRCINIVAAYVVGPRYLCLLRCYWDRLIMVAWAGGYFGTPFKGYCVATQGVPLSSTILNMGADVVHRHCFTVAASID